MYTSQLWENFRRLSTNRSIGISSGNNKRDSMFNTPERIFFVVATVGALSLIFKIKSLYSACTQVIEGKMPIHLVFTFLTILRPLVSKSVANQESSRLLLGKLAKKP